jgi:hypothetical protein
MNIVTRRNGSIYVAQKDAHGIIYWHREARDMTHAHEIAKARMLEMRNYFETLYQTKEH